MPTRLMVAASQVKTLPDGKYEVGLSSASIVAGIIPGELVNLSTRVHEYGTCQVVSVGMGGDGVARLTLRKLGESI